MRATSVPVHPTTDDLVVIEVIDADPAAFDPAGRASLRTPSPSARSRRPARWLLAALVLALIAAAVVATRPWEAAATWRTFPLEIDATTLPAQLVLAEPATPVFSVLEGAEPTTAALLDSGLGHLFAAPGATIERGRWALFRIEQIDDTGVAALPVSAETAVVEAAESGRCLLYTSPSPRD